MPSTVTVIRHRKDGDANPDRAAVTPRPDTTHALRDAQELVALSQSVYTDAQSAASGGVPKDFRERLKKIEELSKKLRSELLLD